MLPGQRVYVTCHPLYSEGVSFTFDWLLYIEKHPIRYVVYLPKIKLQLKLGYTFD
jgi:hypothetical protein